MKFVSLLLALLIIGFLVKKQLAPSPLNTEYDQLIDNHDISNGNLSAPQIPNTPKDIQNFEDNINEFILNTAKQRQKQIEASSNP